MWTWFYRLLQMAPLLAAICWTCYPAFFTVRAMATMPLQSLQASAWRDREQTLVLRRQLQRHFLAHSVYLPLEDISTAPAPGAAGDDTSLLMQKACGRGRLLVWLPFKFNLPIFGEKVIEWCWKPQTKDA